MTKKVQTVKKLPKIVGRREVVDPKTKEPRYVDVVKMTDADFNFEKIWLTHLLTALDMIGNKKVELLSFMLSNRDYDNRVFGTQRAIAKATGLSLHTVSSTLKALESADALKRVQSGLYQLNPDLVFKGGHSARMSVLLEYSKIDEQMDLFEPEDAEPERLREVG